MKDGFRVGDWVRVVQIPSDLRDPAGISTPKVFERAKGRTFRIEGFDRYGNIELVVTKRHTIWIEPGFVVRVEKPRAR
jgi:hypothetical protein